MRIVLSMLLAASAASADVHTWICTDATGHKAIQDHPCIEGVASRELDAVHNDETWQHWTERQTEKNRNDFETRSHASWCADRLANARGADYRAALARCQ